MIPGIVTKVPPVIVQLLGGLGNQMFQYAAALAVTNGDHSSIEADVSILHDHSSNRHVVNRHFGLDIFSVYPRFASKRSRWLYNSHDCGLGTKVVARLLRRCGAGRGLTHSSFRFDHTLLEKSPRPRYIAGLWQSHRYLQRIELPLRSGFSFREELPVAYHDIASRIAFANAVCINVRRADFVSDEATAKQIGFIGLDYYKSAVSTLSYLIGGKLKFFVFSDEIEWCRQHFQWLGSQAVFVNHDHAGAKFEHYLDLMSRAQVFIIPNSTFAWWAAWLSRSDKKCVIAPKQWFADSSVDATDLFPTDWIRL